jgi:hypothetical protein
MAIFFTFIEQNNANDLQKKFSDLCFIILKSRRGRK